MLLIRKRFKENERENKKRGGKPALLTVRLIAYTPFVFNGSFSGVNVNRLFMILVNLCVQWQFNDKSTAKKMNKVESCVKVEALAIKSKLLNELKSTLFLAIPFKGKTIYFNQLEPFSLRRP